MGESRREALTLATSLKYFPKNISLTVEGEAGRQEAAAGGTMPSKLYIYDTTSGLDWDREAAIFYPDEVMNLTADSIAELHQKLSGLVGKGQTFKRVLF